jgi:hypothetical protein
MEVGMVNDTLEPKTLPPGGAGDDQVVEAEAAERSGNEEPPPSGNAMPQVSANGAAPSDDPAQESKAAQVPKLFDEGYTPNQIEAEGL